jgi:gliding motility-associated-like protein
MKKALPAIIFLLLLIRFNDLLAQFGQPDPPIITYPGPQTFTVGTPIAPPVTPINKGGFGASFTLGGGDSTAVTGILSSGLTIDASGNFYSSNRINNLINKISTAGVVTTFAGSGSAGSANGTGTAASFNNPQGIAIDGMGNIYVADAGNNLIRKITSAGVVTTFAGSGASGSNNGTGTAASFNKPYGVAIDGAGNIYVADAGNYLIREITPAGVVTTFAGSGNSASVDGTGTAASFNQPNGLAIDALGNIYVGDVVQVRKITPAGVVTTLAGSGMQGSADGNGAGASFVDAANIAVDTSGNLYVTDGNIRKVTPAGTVTTYAIINSGATGGITFDHSGNLYIGTGNGLSKIVKTLPPGIVFDNGTGAISGTPTAISPAINYTVEATNDGGSSVTTVSITVNNLAPVISYPQSPLTATAGVAFSISPVYTGGVPGSYTLGAPLPGGISLNSVTGIISGTPSAASPATNYNIIAHDNAGSDTVKVNITVNNPPSAPKISYAGPQTYTVGTAITPLSPSSTGGAVPTATMVSTFAGNGAPGAVNGPRLAASFSNPDGLALDALGDVYVADYNNNLIRKISPAGIVSTFASGFNGPGGLAVDAFGNVFVADVNNNLVKKITPEGVVSTFSNGQGDPNCFLCPHGFFEPSAVAVDMFENVAVADYGNQDVILLAGNGVATRDINAFNGNIFDPRGITEDNFGNVYVADPFNNQIDNITAQTTLAGNGAAGSANGTGPAATFNGPTGLATDAQGNIYVADAGNNLIRKITPAGVVTTLAGSGVPGSANGRDTLASFNNPYALAVDPFGVVYVADAGNNLIRKIIPGGYTISPALPPGLVFDSTTGIISGTPTAISPATNYTVVALNAGGSGTATVNIKVVPPSNNTNLANLKLSMGTLSPNFSSDSTSYTASVYNSISSITVTPTSAYQLAVITVNGVTVASGSPSASIPLSVGPNIITTVVTADSTSKTYTVIVTRRPSDYAFLAYLQLSSGTLNPAFGSGTFAYTARVSRTTFEITVTPTAGNAFATIQVNGMDVASGTASSPIALNDGVNDITIVVTAQNGTSTKTYSLAVTKESSAPNGIYRSFIADNESENQQSSTNEVSVRPAVSPNADGINDVLTINNIENYPDNKVTLINRNGEVIYKMSGYDNVSKVFDGHSNITGVLLKPGTYFYLLEYGSKDGPKSKTGYFVLKY